jgi:hypothetical protein
LMFVKISNFASALNFPMSSSLFSSKHVMN